MRINNRHNDQITFRISYLGKDYLIKTVPKTKINGIVFQQDSNQLIDDNVERTVDKIQRQLKPWSRRALTTLGKILIVKTFGISNVIYLLQSMKLTDAHFKRLNSVLFKFIWNRNFSASKAPERIKREIMNKSTKLGGFGMLDLEELDASLKLRALGRIMNTNHPFLKTLLGKIRLEQFFYPATECDIEGVVGKGLKLLRESRLELLNRDNLYSNRKFIGLIKDIRLSRLINGTGKASVGYNAIWHAGKRRVGDLSLPELGRIRHFFTINGYRAISRVLTLPGSDVNPADSLGMFYGDRYVNIGKLSSKEIRNYRVDQTPITAFKIGLDLGMRDCLSWLFNLNKLSSVRHKNTILKIVHGDVYTRERRHRFGLEADPLCTKCGNEETLLHKILECTYSKKIAEELIAVTNGLRIRNIDPLRVTLEDVLGVTEANYTILTVHAEVLSRILAIRDDTTYLLRPKILVKQSIEQLVKVEKRIEIKNVLRTLL